MSNITYYTKLLEELTTHLGEVEEENVELRIKLNRCEGKLEMLQLFYSDFKRLNRTDVLLDDNQFSGETISKPVSYDILLGEYLVSPNAETLKCMFENYDIKPSQILTDIRNKPPDNILDLVKTYQCKDEYEIIQKSLKHISNFTLPEKSVMALVTSYINNYNRDKKSKALLFLKQALIYFPFQFDKFLENIAQYRFADLDQHIENLKFELYGKGNMLLIDKNYLPQSKKIKVKKSKKAITKADVEIEKPKPVILMVEGKNKTKVDYAILSVDVLVKMITAVKDNVEGNPNLRQRILRTIESMTKCNRSKEEINQFINEVNKLLTKKIPINE
jgi:hypothetical protein